MEETKTIDLGNRPVGEKNTYGGGCPIFIFGDKKSADNDLKGKFEVSDKINEHEVKSNK